MTETYLDKVCLQSGLRVDLQRLVVEMVGNDELLRAHYYHCMPYQSNPPTIEERTRFAAMDRFMTMLRRLPRFEVRLGKLALQGMDALGKPFFDLCDERRELTPDLLKRVARATKPN